MRTLVGDAQAALGHVRDAVAAFTSSLSEELQAGGSLARKLATDAQASHDEVRPCPWGPPVEPSRSLRVPLTRWNLPEWVFFSLGHVDPIATFGRLPG